MKKAIFALLATLPILLLFGCANAKQYSASPTKSSIPAAPLVITATATSTIISPKASFPSGWTTFTNANEMIHGLAFDKEGNLWAASQGGLVKWNTANGTYQKFTTADGLPSNRIDSLLIANDGTLWVGAMGSISSFDGRKWETYRQTSTQDHVFQIFQDSIGRLWFVGRDATTYDGKQWKTYTMADGLGSDDVASIVEDRWHNIWLGTWFLYCGCEGSPKYIEGASRFDGHKWIVLGDSIGLNDKDPMSGIQVNAMAVDSKGGIWFGTSKFGAKYYSGVNTVSFTVADGLPDNTINAIRIDENKTVWFATDHGVATYDGTHWKTFHSSDGLANDTVYAIAISPDKSIWFGTQNGISRFDGSQRETFRTNDALPVTHVNHITSMSDGSVWLATDKGAAYFDGHSWKIMTKNDGLPGNAIRKVAIAPDGSLWFGTPPSWYPDGSGAIAHLTDGKWTITKSLGCSLNEGIEGITFDISGGVWVQSCGLYYFNGNKWTEFPGGNETIVFNGVFSQKSGFWQNGIGGVSQFYNQKWIDYGPEGRNEVGWVGAALTTALNGDIWVASDNSDSAHYETDFLSFEGEHWKLETQTQWGHVTDMSFAKDGTLWVATLDGAYRYDGKNWTHYTVSDGLAGNEITSICVAGDGAIWFATTDGVTRFSN